MIGRNCSLQCLKVTWDGLILLLALHNLKLWKLNVRTVPLRMLSKLCCGLGNLLGLIGRERSNKESEPLHANADLEGHENLGIVRC